jgi:hypothetical protein
VDGCRFAPASGVGGYKKAQKPAASQIVFYAQNLLLRNKNEVLSSKLKLASFCCSHSIFFTSFSFVHKKTTINRGFCAFLAEREGFEPPDLLQSTVFKTAAFDRSAISPRQM